MARLGEGKPYGFGYWQDQHNRTWAGRVTADGDAVGPLDPYEWAKEGWNVHPQCLPPHDAVRPLAKHGAVSRCEINYDALIHEREQEEKGYTRALENLMDQFYGNARTQESPVLPDMRRKLGQRPASSALMRAAKAGVPWAVFGTGPVPPKLKPFLLETRPTVSDERGFWEEGLNDGEGAEDEVEMATATPATDAPPIKRGPGRPRKTTVETGG